MKDFEKELETYEFWFLTGSQHLYGDDTLRQVAANSQKIVESLNEGASLAKGDGKSGKLPFKVVCKPTLTDSASIHKLINEANACETCAGIICWMHTFSPAKIWIRGLSVLDKPLLQFNTQFNEKIPYETMDMDFMNLNQSAHGDREFGYITARMDIPRKVIAGHWSHKSTRNRIALWMRSAVAAEEGKKLVIVRFGDNMRDVAVTCGDKVEGMIQLGWSVPYYGIGDLVTCIQEVSNSDIDAKMAEYTSRYIIATHSDAAFAKEQIREQAKIEIAMRRFMQQNKAWAFTTNFQDLHGIKQLPGLACQNMMADGWGFAGEGDWKTAAMVRTMKIMAAGIENGGTSFMEDYTYNLEEGNMQNLGAHMLEICPSIAASKPSIEVHPLGIGDKADPARLVFDGKEGQALCAAIVDMGNRLRIVVNEVKTIKPTQKFEKLPVARALWQPLPNFVTSSEAWILAGGGHHTSYSDTVSLECLRDYAEICNIEILSIGDGTTIPAFRNEIRWNVAAYK